MKTALLTILALTLATAAVAGPIIDIQTGLVAVDTEVIVTQVVVTGVRYNGAFVTEVPNAPYAGIWVYTGSDPGVVAGDLVSLKGIYKEYYDLSEIDVSADPTGYFNNLGSYWDDVAPLSVTISQIAADGEPYESCFIHLVDEFSVTELGSYGEWTVQSWLPPNDFLVMDDYWYDPAPAVDPLEPGDVFNGAVGCLYYSFGAFKFEPFADGMGVNEAPIATDEVSFGQVKSLFR